MTKASDQGYPPAQCNLGIYYLYGKVVEKDEIKAKELLTEASDRGSETAQENLAQFYAYGLGGARSDPKKSEELMAKRNEKKCNLFYNIVSHAANSL